MEFFIKSTDIEDIPMKLSNKNLSFYFSQDYDFIWKLC